MRIRVCVCVHTSSLSSLCLSHSCSYMRRPTCVLSRVEMICSWVSLFSIMLYSSIRHRICSTHRNMHMRTCCTFEHSFNFFFFLLQAWTQEHKYTPPPWSGSLAVPATCRVPVCFLPEKEGISSSCSKNPWGCEPAMASRCQLLTQMYCKRNRWEYLSRSRSLWPSYTHTEYIYTHTMLANSSPSSSQATPPGL